MLLIRLCACISPCWPVQFLSIAVKSLFNPNRPVEATFKVIHSPLLCLIEIDPHSMLVLFQDKYIYLLAYAASVKDSRTNGSHAVFLDMALNLNVRSCFEFSGQDSGVLGTFIDRSQLVRRFARLTLDSALSAAPTLGRWVAFVLACRTRRFWR